MFACEKQEEHFYVYTTKDTFTEKIKFTPNYTANLPNFENFFNNYTCPELFHKLLSKVIARSILKDTVDASTCASQLRFIFNNFKQHSPLPSGPFNVNACPGNSFCVFNLPLGELFLAICERGHGHCHMMFQEYILYINPFTTSGHL